MIGVDGSHYYDSRIELNVVTAEVCFLARPEDPCLNSFSDGIDGKRYQAKEW